MMRPLNVIINAFDSVATTQKTTPIVSSGRCLDLSALPAIVAMTPAATRSRPAASAGEGTLFSTTTAHAAQTTGMDARMTWLNDNERCNRDALLSAMLSDMNAPMAASAFHSRPTVCACVSPAGLPLKTTGASEHIWNTRCAHVRETGYLNPACPSVYRFSRLRDEFNARYRATMSAVLTGLVLAAAAPSLGGLTPSSTPIERVASSRRVVQGFLNRDS